MCLRAPSGRSQRVLPPLVAAVSCAVLCACAATPVVVRAAETRSADDVFKKWLTWQAVREDVALGPLAAKANVRHVIAWRDLMPKAMAPRLGALHLPAGTDPPTDAEIQACLKATTSLIALFDGRVGEAAALLGRGGFGSAQIEKAESSGEWRPKYRDFLAALLWQPDIDEARTALFAASNRFFEFAFSPATYPILQTLAGKPESRAVVRLLYESMWYYLARTGWSHWHRGAIDAMKAHSDGGGEVVYVAGGTDILALVGAGITHITVIDPMFPSQTKYYSEGWEFLISGAAGDTITFAKTALGPLRATRTSFVARGEFTTDKLSDGSKRTLRASTTVWTLTDAQGKPRGTFTLERRFLTQADLVADPTRMFVLSFNELYYVVTKAWGIDPRKLPAGFRFVVKQLARPVDRPMLWNLAEVEASSFPFQFGSAVD